MTEETTTSTAEEPAPATQRDDIATPDVSGIADSLSKPKLAPSAADQSPANFTDPVLVSEPGTSPEEEPQNALTRKFTETEWKAMKELRKALPEILAEVFPDRSDAKTTQVKLWGITLDPSSSKDARVSVILVKFLRARNLNVHEARAMLVSTLRWRDEFKPEDIIKEEFPEDIFGKLGHVYGHDNGGRPVTYNLFGGNQDLSAVFGNIPRFIRWRVALMEKGVGMLDFESVDQLVQIHDYEGVGLSSRTANSKNAATEATRIFSDHYPELLYKKFFVNVPTIMTWVFWAFKSLLPAQTFAKMSVVGNGPQTIGRALLPVIEADQLPARYGGKADAF